MIVVSLKRSYPNLVDDVRAGTEGMAFFRLEGITKGDWPKMSAEKLDGYMDFVVGTYNDMIVTAYPIGGFEEVEGTETIRFTSPEPNYPDESFNHIFRGTHSSNNSGDPAEWLIGCPIPGGSWKRGEARGTRRYALSDYLTDHPELASRRDGDFGSRMARNLLDHFAKGRPLDSDDYPRLSMPDKAAPKSSPETGVTVVRQPGGTVVITIPTGTRAQIQIDPEGSL